MNLLELFNPISVVVALVVFILIFYLVYTYLTKDLDRSNSVNISVYVYSTLVALTFAGITGYFFNKYYPNKKELLRGDFFKV